MRLRRRERHRDIGRGARRKVKPENSRADRTLNAVCAGVYRGDVYFAARRADSELVRGDAVEYRLNVHGDGQRTATEVVLIEE